MARRPSFVRQRVGGSISSRMGKGKEKAGETERGMGEMGQRCVRTGSAIAEKAPCILVGVWVRIRDGSESGSDPGSLSF